MGNVCPKYVGNHNLNGEWSDGPWALSEAVLKFIVMRNV
jgi:hypothetical protein